MYILCRAPYEYQRYQIIKVEYLKCSLARHRGRGKVVQETKTESLQPKVLIVRITQTKSLIRVSKIIRLPQKQHKSKFVCQLLSSSFLPRQVSILHLYKL